MARIVAMIVVAALAAMPAGALGATGELTPQPSQPLLEAPAQQEQPAPAQVPAETPESAAESRIGPGELALIVLVVGGLIGGIWFAISRDARRATRGRTPQPAGETGLGAGGSATRAARRSRKLSTAERRRRKRGKAR